VGIKRRSLLVAGAVTPVATGALGPSPATAATAAPAGPSGHPGEGDDSAARAIDLANGWKFVLVNPFGITDPTGRYAAAQNSGFDDSRWRTVAVPHDWSIELDPDAAPDTASGTGFFHGGLGWYRKTFTLPKTLTGKRISVEFDGVYMDSYVYVNGQLVGNHPYGYTGFSFDLTPWVKTDGATPNVLAVKVQNQQPSSRWYSGSGIYRRARLVVTDPIHVRRWGAFVTTPDLDTTIASGYATVRVRTNLVNEQGGRADVRIVSTVLDAAGHPVGRAESKASVGSEGHTDTVDLRVQRPTLWSTDNPYLYTLQTDLVAGGRTVDTYRTTFGIRYFRIDPGSGLSLNGEHLKLQGVDLHHDQGALGAAVNADALARQMTIMKSMGVNALRTSHNPPAPELIDICQRLGILMMVEAFDCWQHGKNSYDYGRFFDANCEADITEMVNAAKNSPAVIIWSVGNEIPDSTSTAGLAMAQRLIDAVKAVDATRPVVIGSDKYRGLPKPGSAADLMLAKLDGLGLNYNTAASVDALHARYPHLFLFESESSSQTSTRGAYQEPEHLNTGENHTPGKRSTSSYDNNLASWTMSGEYGLKKDRDRRFFAGQFLWSGMDYIGEPTPYDVFPVKASFFGAVDTAGFPKDMYHLFRSQWTTQPMVHLVPMNWTDHEAGEAVEVWAYSNMDSVELFLNGVSQGVRTFDHKTTVDGRRYLETTEATHDDKTFTSGPYPGSYTSPNGSAGKLHLAWRVPFAAGKLVAVARRGGVEVARDELSTAGPAYALRLTPDKKVIAAGGRSLSYLTVEVVDAAGVVVPAADDLIGFTVTGGRLAGVDNGRQESAENYQAAQRHAFNGKALAIIEGGGRPGPITVTATATGRLPAVETIYSVDRPGDQLVGLDPARLRVPLGQTPRLPRTVRGIAADGSERALPVDWRRVPAAVSREPGVYPVEGTARGTHLRAQAVITVYRPANVESYSTAIPVGATPALPIAARVGHSDGVEQFAPVTWKPVAPERYATAGLVTATGTVAGTDIPAVASIRVTDVFTAATNIALSTNPTRPTADASYSGAPNTLPAAMLDGDAATGGWSNAFDKAPTALLPRFNMARPRDWVSVSWANPQRFGTVKAYFVTSASCAPPAEIEVTYWDGARDVPVRGLTVTSDVATTLTFEPVTTTRLRLAMTSAFPDTTKGHIQIAELEVTGDAVTYHTRAALADLRVDGRTVAGFDPAVTSYTVRAGSRAPTVTATASDNGRVYVAAPPSPTGTARVVVTAEDGLSQRRYTIEVLD
jgi:beta-galactosidase